MGKVRLFLAFVTCLLAILALEGLLIRLSAEEPPPHGTGFIPWPVDVPYQAGPAFVPFGSLPSHFDWREQGKINPVGDQGSCGACYAFAGLGNVESKIMIDGGPSYDFSENNLKECPVGGFKCTGGNTWVVANHLATRGTVLGSCDPYSPSITGCNPSCPPIKTLLSWRVVSFDNMPSPEVLKTYIMAFGPLFSAFNSGHGDSWYSEFYNYDGTYTLYYAGGGAANHAVLIVGWDDTLPHAGGQGAWICKNSWGTDWGGPSGYGTERGYFTIAYGSAKVGTYASCMDRWEDYDSEETLLCLDEAGPWGIFGFASSLEAWEMCKYVPASDLKISRIEFWTMDAVADADFYLYDDLEGAVPTNLITSKLDMTFETAGYQSVVPDSPVMLTAGDDVYAVLKLRDASYVYPLAYDSRGPKSSGSCFVSSDGVGWSSFTAGDLGVRLRMTSRIDMEPPVISLAIEPEGSPAGAVAIEVRSSEALSDTSVHVSAGGGPVAMEALDEARTVYRGTHSVTAAGTLSVQARARDLAGNQGADSVECEVSVISPREGGTARSSDGKFEAVVRAQAATAETVFAFVSGAPATGAGVIAVYDVRPAMFADPFVDFAEVSIRFDEDVPDPGHLTLSRLDAAGNFVSALKSFVDTERHRVVAYVDSLGLFALYEADTVSSGMVRTEGIAFQPSYPNPFRDETTVIYDVPEPGPVAIEIFTVTGRLVRHLFSGDVTGGLHRMTWDGADGRGRRVASGVYFLMVTSRGNSASTKVLLVN